MDTYALFEDGSASRLVFDFFSANPRDDPVRLAFPDIDDAQVRNSARNGCLAAFQVLAGLDRVHSKDPYFLSCQFAESRANLNAQGSSAGLAFCPNFALQVCRLCGEQFPEGSIAATGTISNGTRAASVEGVKGISAKLRAAVGFLRPGERVFYPAENEQETEAGIEETAARRGIALIPVATVAQAVAQLLPSTPKDPGKGTRFARRFLLVALLGACGAGLCFFLAQAAGHRLHLEVQFHHTAAHQQGTVPLSPGLSGPAGALALQSGDLYRISCTADDSCYLYIFQLDSQGKLAKLPDPAPRAAPPFLRAGTTYRFPAGAEQWFVLDEREGQETIYVVAA